MSQIHPYLNFAGNCEDAFNTYQKIFGGKINYIGRYKDMPADSVGEVGEEDKDKVMHISLSLPGGTHLMGSDMVGKWKEKIVEGNNVHLSINTSSEEETKRFFEGLSEGGNVSMPLEKTFWAKLFGMVKDKYGIHWMLSYE